MVLIVAFTVYAATQEVTKEIVREDTCRISNVFECQKFLREGNVVSFTVRNRNDNLVVSGQKMKDEEGVTCTPLKKNGFVIRAGKIETFEFECSDTDMSSNKKFMPEIKYYLGTEGPGTAVTHQGLIAFVE